MRWHRLQHFRTCQRHLSDRGVTASPEFGTSAICCYLHQPQCAVFAQSRHQAFQLPSCITVSIVQSFTRAKHTGRIDPPLILSVGRLRSKKGLDILVKACARLRKSDIAFRCEIIGYGPEELALRGLIDSHGLQQHVRMTGKLGHDEVLDRMRTARIFALPCRIDADGDRDGIPNVILEAMAMGLPVVSTPVSGVPEIVEHGRTGWLVPPDDAAALADRMGALISDGADAHVVGAARHAVHSRFGEGRDIAMLDRLLLGATAIQNRPVSAMSSRASRACRKVSSALKSCGWKNWAEDHGLCIVARRRNGCAGIGGPCFTARLYAQRRFGAKSTSRRVAIAGDPGFCAIPLASVPQTTARLVVHTSQTWRFARAYCHAKDRCAKRSYFKQFLQAGAIAEALPRAGVTHLHGHFCHNATTITWFAARMAGCSFSFTAHAKDIYQERHNPGDLLARKIEAATFVTTCTSANHAHLEAKLGAAHACTLCITVWTRIILRPPSARRAPCRD